MGQVSPRQMLEAQAELERQKLLPRRIKGARVPRPWEIETQVHLSASLNPLPGLVDGKRLGKSSVARATPLTISPVKRRKGKNAGRTDVRNIKRQKQIGLLLKGDDRHVKVNGIMEQYRPSTADHLSHIKRIVLKDEKTRVLGSVRNNILFFWRSAGRIGIIPQSSTILTGVNSMISSSS